MRADRGNLWQAAGPKSLDLSQRGKLQENCRRLDVGPADRNPKIG
jgi:hypothetical protein